MIVQPVPIKPTVPAGAPYRLMRADYASGWCLLTVQTVEGQREFLARTLTKCLDEFRYSGGRLAI